MGGNRLNDEFAKGIEMSPLAETWNALRTRMDRALLCLVRVSGDDLDGGVARTPRVSGTHPQTKGELPILIKFIDAKKDLSVQVHPTDEYAIEKENGQLGKTEMWYVLDASLIYGLQKITEEAVIREAIAQGTVERYLQKVPVKKNDVFFIEAGTIHAIGAGALIAEIQENSNLTYRLYDYDRVDKNGKKRELHVDKALEVANLKGLSEPKQPLRVLKYRAGVAAELLCRCKHFEVSRMIVNTERRQTVHYRADSISFRVLLCVNGCGTVRFDNESLDIYKGDCLFVPADSTEISIHGSIQFLDVRG